MPLSRRLTIGLGIATATTLATITSAPLTVAAAPAPAHVTAARDAASWLAGEFKNGSLPGPFTPEDWGSTIDGLVALSATGVDAQTRQAATAQVAQHVRSYNSYDDWGIEGFTDGGATAKLLDAEPPPRGPHRLRRLRPAGGNPVADRHGRRRAPAGTDHRPYHRRQRPGRQQHLRRVLRRARPGPQRRPATYPVDFLSGSSARRAASGSTRTPPTGRRRPATTSPGATLDVDSTAMAVQALLAAAEDGATGAGDAARKGADWLVTQQHADGSFGGSGPTTGANSNSTGLAGQALAAAGRDDEAARAATALAALQLTAGNGGAASADAGAIAYNTDGFTDPSAAGITDTDRDQWRRAPRRPCSGWPRSRWAGSASTRRPRRLPPDRHGLAHRAVHALPRLPRSPRRLHRPAPPPAPT